MGKFVGILDCSRAFWIYWCSLDYSSFTPILGFVWSDLLTNLERVSDHCSNISGSVLDTIEHNMNIHENQRFFRDSDKDFFQLFAYFKRKYLIPINIS